jgi:hypothetical protein
VAAVMPRWREAALGLVVVLVVVAASLAASGWCDRG